MSSKSKLVGLAAALSIAAVALSPPRLLSQDPEPRPAPAPNERDAGELDRLRDAVRRLEAELAEQRSRTGAILDHLVFAPETETEDYARARSRFRTKLVRHGPAPQAWTPIEPPDRVTVVEYPSGDLRLRAWVSRPADDHVRCPAVLFLHGGFAFGLGAWEYTVPYRDAGFVLMAPMLRAENGQPGAWSYFHDEVDDVLAAADYLARQPYVDPSHVFVAGHSIGGTLALLAAQASGRFRAAASFDCSLYKPEFVTRRMSMPFDTSDPREGQIRSPMAFASSFKCPARIYYASEARGASSAVASLRTAVLAKRRGLDVEAVEIEGDHDSHVARAMMQSIAFFLRYSPRGFPSWSGDAVPLPETLELDLGDGIALEVARIEPGKFRMGSPPAEPGRGSDEGPREAAIDEPFGIGVHEVTQAQYRRVMGVSPSGFSPSGDHRDAVVGSTTDEFPVENVSWDDAMDFCRIVSTLPDARRRGWVVDLPTETEWEYACRAGTVTAFHCGDALTAALANCGVENPRDHEEEPPPIGRPARVGSYAPNAFGLYDMHGNVAEWCKDAFDAGGPCDAEEHAAARVVRGGSFASEPIDCRSARRRGDDPDRRVIDMGFRVVIRSRR